MARGHEVRLMPAQYVKPYVKRGKNDAADAEAICEAVTRPTMRFVPVKTPEQQSVMMLRRVRLMLNRQRTQLSNSIRAHLSEFGIVAPIGRRGVDQLLAVVANDKDTRVPADARLCLQMLVAQLAVVKEQILENDRRVRASARETELGRRLMEVPGARPLLASALVATVADPAAFKTGRDLAAWIGLVTAQEDASENPCQRRGRPHTASCVDFWSVRPESKNIYLTSPAWDFPRFIKRIFGFPSRGSNSVRFLSMAQAT